MLAVLDLKDLKDILLENPDWKLFMNGSSSVVG